MVSEAYTWGKPFSKAADGYSFNKIEAEEEIYVQRYINYYFLPIRIIIMIYIKNPTKLHIFKLN